MKPTRENSSPTWCSTFATTRRGVVQRSGLIPEAFVPDERRAAGPTRRPKQEVFDRQFQILVGWDANRVLDAACLQRLVDRRPRKGGVGPECHALALGLLAFNLRQEQLVPVVGAGDVARSQLGRQTVAVIVPWQRRLII
jgi:hypothetical protein